MPTSTKLSVNNQKVLVHILVVLILLAGLGATLYLSQKPQIFKPRAFDQVTAIVMRH